MWGMFAVLALITIILSNFIVPRNLPRFVVLVVLWLVSFEILEIIVAVMIINMAQFSRPDQSVRQNNEFEFDK